MATDRRKRPADVHQAIGIAIGQRAKQNPIERAEHRGGGAQPQRQDQYGGQREARLTPPRAPGEVRVLPQRVPPLGDPDAAYRLARPQHVAETTARRSLVHAVVFRAHRDVGLELLAHLVVGWSSAEPARQAHRSTLFTPSVSVAQLSSISFRRLRPALVSR